MYEDNQRYIWSLHYLALFNGKVPSSDNQCSVRDAMDVLTPARTHSKGREREREVCVKWAWLAKGKKGEPTLLGTALPEVHITGHLWQEL